ncbi:MAG: aldehyde dehydrogenase family protein [Thermaerobacter sp.]|nr:aldehyde dehydrogenase family protein [Thermaerobacter sp.]
MGLPPFANEPLLNFSDPDELEYMREAHQRVLANLGMECPVRIGDRDVYGPHRAVVHCPDAVGLALGSVVMGGAADAAEAVRVAHGAFESWSRTSVEERAALLLRAGNILRHRRRHILTWMALEVGKNFDQADGEVAEAIDHFEWNARQLFAWAQGRPLAPHAQEINEYRYRPLGVGAVIAPWNFPATLPLGMVVAAIAAGNTVVLKPSEHASLTAHHLVQILRDAGIPPGVVNLVPGTGALVGDALVSDPRVRFVAFVGSRDVGIRIAERASTVAGGQHHLKRVMTEMGGKNATIVTDSADFEWAVAEVTRSALGFQGQKCSATSRVICLPGIHDRFVEALQAHMEATASKRGRAVDNAPYGALVSAQARNKVESYVATASTHGRVLLEGQRDPTLGYCVTPTLVDRVDPQSPLAQEEIFGPVVAVLEANTLPDAVAVANNVPYALTGAAFTHDPHELDFIREHFYVGNLYLNRSSTGAMAGVHPFGGYKLSGTGPKVGGPDYLGFFLEAQVITQAVRYPDPRPAGPVH